jgi:hypothetical protein
MELERLSQQVLLTRLVLALLVERVLQVLSLLTT